MKKLLSLFKKRWVISLLGVTALAALIWFAGPFIGIGQRVPLASGMVRLLAILFIVVCWGLNNLRKQLKNTRANNQIIDDIAGSTEGPAVDLAGTDESAEEVDVLKQRFDDAMVILKKSRQKEGGGSLYDLPWYIIIGPPGAGKTTALLNSGLKFPLKEHLGGSELKGVGGTRNCDWLFTDRAVLLDTAGRYVTQDSHAQVDSAAWKGFLDLLKKHRRRRPVNGVLVAISLVDLMQQDAHERDAHVRAIKQRIQELYEHFGVQLPVYVMLTKCDLVAGFTEFFDDLGREEREQVWGTTFPFDDEGEEGELAIRFDKEFDLLLERLNARLFQRLSQERDAKRRSLIYAFPQQMNSLKATLSQFVSGVFQSNRFEEPIMLRGVYLTSGTQEGRPIDRLMGAMARTFGFDRQSLMGSGGHGRSYFLTRLLGEVVFPESGLAGYNSRLESRRAWLQRGAYAGVMLVTAIALLAWFASYTANKNYLSEVNESLVGYHQQAENPGNLSGLDVLLPRLDSLKNVNHVANQHEGDVPVHMRLWLYQGDALGDVATDAYKREINSRFIPFMVRRLEEQLGASESDPEFQYEALKTYLMLGNPQRMELQHVKLWMEQDWQNQFPNDTDKQTRLQNHLESLLEGARYSAKLNQNLIVRVRKRLNRVPLAELVYGRLKRESLFDDGTYFRVRDAAGSSVDDAFVRKSGRDLDQGIPGLFTATGFFQSYKAESLRLADQMRKESWVLGNEATEAAAAEFQQLEKEMREIYMRDYISSWDSLLSDLRIQPFKNVRHGVQILEVLSSPSSPLINLLEAVEKNTALNRVPGGVQGVAKAVGNKVKSKSRFARLFGNNTDIDVSTNLELPGHKIDRHFEILNRLVQSNEGRSPPIDRLIALLSELYGQLAAIDSGYSSGEGSTGLQSSLQRLQVAASRLPEPVKGWMKQLAYNSQMASMDSARKGVAEVWAGTIRPGCENALNNRYPFGENGQLDVAMDDFTRFFSPSGKFEQFYKDQLEPLVDRSSTTWKWRSSQGGLSKGALGQIQRAEKIKEAFFQAGGKTPVVHFSLKPVYLDAQIKRFTIDLAGQQFVYRHGPSIAISARWPGLGESSEVRIIAETIDGVQASIIRDGPWAWFKILDQADIELISPDRFIATFTVDGYKAKYEVRARSVVNPFVMQALRKFRCPYEF